MLCLSVQPIELLWMFRKMSRSERSFIGWMQENCRAYSNHSKMCFEHIKIMDEEHKVPAVSPSLSSTYVRHYFEMSFFSFQAMRKCCNNNQIASFHSKASGSKMISIKPPTSVSVQDEREDFEEKKELEQVDKDKLNEKFDALLLDANAKTRSVQRNLTMIQKISLELTSGFEKDFGAKGDSALLKAKLVELLSNQKKTTKSLTSLHDRLGQFEEIVKKVEFDLNEMESKLTLLLKNDNTRTERAFNQLEMHLEKNQREFLLEMRSIQSRKAVSKRALVSIIIFAVTLSLANEELLEYGKKIFIHKN